MQNNCLILSAFLFLFLFAVPVMAQETYNIDHICRFGDNWNDGVYDVQEVGENYYMACGLDGFRVVGWVGRDDEPWLDELDQYACADARAVAVSNNYAYVGTLDNGMYIIDVTYPRAIWMIRRVIVDASMGFGTIKISGNYAFLCCSPGGLNIVDISNPHTAYVFNSIPAFDDVKDVVIQDSLAYLACGDKGLAIFNMANLQSPQLLNNYICTDSASVNGVAISGGYAYLACDGVGLRVIDLNSLQMVASIDSLTNGDKIRLNQDFIHMIYGENHRNMALISYSDPLSPQTVGIYRAFDRIYNFSFSLYCPITANGRRGLRFINVYDPTSPGDMYSFNNYRRYLGLAMLGETVLGQDEFRVNDFYIMNIEEPWLRGSLDLWRDYRSLRVLGNWGYIAQDGDTGLILLYLGNGYPNYYGEFVEHDCGIHSDVAIYGNYAYLVQPNGLRIINIANHDSLWQAGFFSYPLAQSKAIVFGHYLYVQDNNLNLLRLDITDTLNPAINCQYPLNQSCQDLKAINTNLYLVTNQKLWIFDAADYDSLRLLSETTLLTEPGASLHGIEYKRDHLFVVGDLIGLRVYYIGNPVSPLCTGYSLLSDKAMGVALTGNIAIVADYANLDFYDCSVAADIGESEPTLPDKFALLPNYPNPFNGSTLVRFELSKSEQVTLQIFDILGRKVATLADRVYEPGVQSLIWNGSAENGKNADSGMYFIKARAGNETRFLKITLLK